jgi:UDP-N-acetylmuramoyl-tripeptide--D-alanyl-D-alanine ligase
VAKAKAELYEHLRKVNGVALYNDKDHLLSEKIFRLINRAVPFSDPTGVDLIIELLPSELNLKISITYLHQNYTVETNLFGNYNLENIRAAVATGLFLDATMEDIIDALENYVPANNRSQVKTTEKNLLICDSYNANPTSMSLAINAFSALKNGEKIAILGDMLELGDKSYDEHLKVLNDLKAHFKGDVLLVGPAFGAAASDSGFRTFENTDSLAEYIKVLRPEGKAILIKGSRGIRLEKIYDLL